MARLSSYDPTQKLPVDKLCLLRLLLRSPLSAPLLNDEVGIHGSQPLEESFNTKYRDKNRQEKVRNNAWDTQLPNHSPHPTSGIKEKYPY